MAQSGRLNRRTLAGIALSASLLGAIGGCESEAPTPSDDRIQRGFEIAPVTLDLTDKDHAMVGLGSYLVNAQGGCNDCHTCPPYAPGHDPFKGEEGRVNAASYLAGGIPFGPVVSTNITPDASGLPGGLTMDEFLLLMHTGEDPDEPGRILQVMPWPVYAGMTEEDLRAVYEYLRSIRHADPGTCQ
jgi:hypothetical protein